MNKTLWIFLLSIWALPACAQTASKALMDMLDRIDRLQAEIQQLRGDADKIRYDLDRMKDRQQSLYLDLDKRLLDLEGGGTGSAPPQAQEQSSREETTREESSAEESFQSPDPAEQPVAQSEVLPGEDQSKQGRNNTEIGSQESIYQEAFVYLNNGRYDDAIADFSRLIEGFPDGEYADNSQYWLGETYYVKRDFDKARDHFNQVMEKYPESDKVPDALLKLGYIEYELSQWKSARKIFNSVIEQYPASNSAQLAQDRLDRMRREAH